VSRQRRKSGAAKGAPRAAERPSAETREGNGSRLVYSSEHGRVCPECGRPQARCLCRERAHAPRGDGVVRVQRERKGRRGKTVTTITGVPLPPDELRELAAELKRRCGTGGSTKNGVIEIQGDHGEALIEALRSRGYAVAGAGRVTNPRGRG
jgi:translation initiation factor 1